MVKGVKAGTTNILITALGITKEVQSVQINGSVIDESDYTVSYEDNINVGEAKVIITGTGNYTGSADEEMTYKVTGNNTVEYKKSVSDKAKIK